jgi:hypothetical protein
MQHQANATGFSKSIVETVNIKETDNAISNHTPLQLNIFVQQEEALKKHISLLTAVAIKLHYCTGEDFHND